MRNNLKLEDDLFKPLENSGLFELKEKSSTSKLYQAPYNDSHISVFLMPEVDYLRVTFELDDEKQQRKELLEKKLNSLDQSEYRLITGSFIAGALTPFISYGNLLFTLHPFIPISLMCLGGFCGMYVFQASNISKNFDKSEIVKEELDDLLDSVQELYSQDALDFISDHYNINFN